MGALAPVVSSWIPEDDLLLKNAIEVIFYFFSLLGFLKKKKRK